MKIDLKTLTSKEFKKLQKDYDKICLDIELLSERERKYLKSIIDPYFGKIKYIAKKKNNSKSKFYFGYYLSIGFVYSEYSNNIFEAKMPIIETKRKLLFEKLVLNHKYSREDLFGEYLYTLSELVNNQETIGIDCESDIKISKVIHFLKELGVKIQYNHTAYIYDDTLRNENGYVIHSAVITNKGEILSYNSYDDFKEYSNKFLIYDYDMIDIEN